MPQPKKAKGVKPKLCSCPFFYKGKCLACGSKVKTLPHLSPNKKGQKKGNKTKK